MSSIFDFFYVVRGFFARRFFSRFLGYGFQYQGLGQFNAAKNLVSKFFKMVISKFSKLGAACLGVVMCYGQPGIRSLRPREICLHVHAVFLVFLHYFKAANRFTNLFQPISLQNFSKNVQFFENRGFSAIFYSFWPRI